MGPRGGDGRGEGHGSMRDRWPTLRMGNDLAPVSGTLTASKTVPGRGESRTTPGGAVGIYVGTGPTGLEWFAYHPQDFLELCSHFDRRTK
jgi:hypothetical protein